MKGKTLSLSVHPDQAAHALRVLITEGKIAARDVVGALRRREALIADLKQKLAALEGKATAKDGPFPTKPTSMAARSKPRRRLSAARRAALKLHGQYLGAVRKLSKASRGKVKAIRAKSGVKAAVAAAKRMAK